MEKDNKTNKTSSSGRNETGADDGSRGEKVSPGDSSSHHSGESNDASQPQTAAPSRSAEQQWLRTFVNPVGNEDPREVTPSFFQSTAPPQASSHLLPFHGVSTGLRLTPSQLAAQKRLEQIQKDMNGVIGVSNWRYEDKGERLVYVCESQRNKRIRSRKQTCILLGLVLLLGLLLVTDYFLFGWFIGSESNRELLEAILKKKLKLNETSPTSLSVTLHPFIPGEVKNVQVTGTAKEYKLGDQIPRAHDVLDPALIILENDQNLRANYD